MTSGYTQSLLALSSKQNLHQRWNTNFFQLKQSNKKSSSYKSKTAREWKHYYSWHTKLIDLESKNLSK